MVGLTRAINAGSTFCGAQVTGLLSAQIAGVNASLNARIDDLNGRLQ